MLEVVADTERSIAITGDDRDPCLVVGLKAVEGVDEFRGSRRVATRSGRPDVES
jgi:hypothetical protein